MANTVSRLANTGNLQTYSYIDEVTNNPNAMGSISFTAASTQYLNLPTSAASSFTFGAGDFTIEFWVNFTSFVSGASQIFDLRPAGTSSTTNYIVIGASTAGVISTTLSATTITGPTLSINTWYHVAVARASGTSRLYINGSQVGSSVSDSTSYTVGANRPIIGADGNNPSATYALNGYISNFRIVKGTAVYTSAFTPPKQPLTPITNTSLLLNTPYTKDAFLDSSPNAFTVTNVGTALSIASTPFLPNAYYGIYFNGSKLTAPSSGAFTLSSGNWTIETWLYQTAVVPASNQCRFIMIGVNGTSNSFTVYLNPDSTISASRPLTGSTGVSSNTSIALNTWYHVAVVSNAGSATIYFNGKSVTTTPVTITQPGTGAAVLNIGYDTVGTVNAQFSGYLSNIRISNNSAIYTSNFTPPLYNLPPGSASLVTGQSPTIIDNSPNAFTLTNTNNCLPLQLLPSYAANLGLTVSKQYSNGVLQTFNNFDEMSLNPNLTGSISLNGTSQYLTWSSGSGVAFGTGNFTVEAWIYLTATQASQYIIDARDSTHTTSWAFGFGLSGAGRLGWYSSGAIRANDASTTDFPTGQWFHVAYVRSGTTGTIYRNGVSVATATDSINYTVTPTTSTIGSYYGLVVGGYFPGYISNLRIVSGVAVYTGTFTPPTNLLTITQGSGTNISAITNTASTTLLLRTLKTDLTDISVYNNPIAKVGSPTNSTVSPFPIIGFPDGYFSTYFNGSAYYTVPANTSLVLAGSNYTVEYWMYPTLVNGTQQDLVNKNLASTFGYTFRIETDNTMTYYTDNGNLKTSALANNTWYHVATTYDGTTTRLFLNGTLANSSSSVTIVSADDTSTQALYVGARASDQFLKYNGYISNLRIVKGTALYTTGFTPSTSPLTTTSQSANASQVSLLTSQSSTLKDNSLNGYTLTSSSTTQQTSPIPFATPNFVLPANTTVMKLSNTGITQIFNQFDEVTGTS